MVTYLQQALGFFIQLYPCALMIFLPFREEAYRFRRRMIYLCLTLASAAFACAYAALVCLRDLEKYHSHIAISNPGMMAAMLLILAAYVWLVRESLLKKLLVFFSVLFYAIFVFILVNTLRLCVPGGGDVVSYAYNPEILSLYAGITVVLLPVMLIFVIRPLGMYIWEIEPKNMKREFFILIVSTLLFVTVTFCCDEITGSRNSLNLETLVLLRCVLMLVILVDQITLYWLVFRESVRQKRDNERQRAMEIQQLQYEKIVGDMENTRRMRHDLRHHYNTLNDMLSRGQTEEMKAYLAGVIDTTVKRDTELYCKNLTVNGLLQYYVGLARDEGIRCRVRAECGELTVESADLTVLFGNAMENAINACRKYQGTRWIDVQVGAMQGSLAIEVSNSCKGVRINRHYQTEDGFSPAAAFLSDHGGGYGLRSMENTAQKYGGSASFRFNAEKEMFTARIWLNIQE